MARREDKAMSDLMDKFVCVRVVQMWGVDLSVFQFDGSLTWAVMFLNADKTIYGRYGSRSDHGGVKDISPEGFRKALQGALDLHKGHPGNKKDLSGKTGPSPKWPTLEKFPAIGYKVGQWDASGRKAGGCVHCHNVDDSMIKSAWMTGNPVGDNLVWNYPLPDVLGLTLDVKESATVQSIGPGSAAEKAGFKPGDKILRMEGQPLISIADVQWVLQTAKEPGSVKAEVERGGKPQELTLTLAAGWRRAMNWEWKEEIHWLGPGIGTKELSSAEKKSLGLSDAVMALRVENVGKGIGIVGTAGFGAQSSGVTKGDVIVAVDGKTTLLRRCDFVAYFWQNKKRGEKVELTLLRAGKNVKATVTLP